MKQLNKTVDEKKTFKSKLKKNYFFCLKAENSFSPSVSTCKPLLTGDFYYLFIIIIYFII